MKTLNWKNTDWSGKNFISSIGQEIIGQLNFYSHWNFNAVYTNKETNLRFVQNGFWESDVTITKDGEPIGAIHNGLFGQQSLKLKSGDRFILSASFWEQEVYWKTENGELIIKLQQATMSSMGKGLISLNDSLSIETEKLRISSGLFARQLRHKRAAMIIVIILPIITAARRL